MLIQNTSQNIVEIQKAIIIKKTLNRVFREQKMARSMSLMMLVLLCIMWFCECGYLTPEHVQDHIKRLISQKYQLYVINLGQTVNNNSLKAYVITGIKVQQSSIGQLLHYPATLITSYMHPRQPYSTKLMQTVLDEVLNNYHSDYFFRYMLDNTLLILFPFVNIDGYYLYEKLVQNNANKNEKQSYRKNMNKYGKCIHDWQYGVDINRNFPSSWGSLRTSDQQCGQQYRGPTPFSQKQSRAIRTLYSKFKITLAIDIHSYGNQWIYPYASQSTNDKFESNELYPLYSDLFDEFDKLKRPMKGCYQSLGYVADGVVCYLCYTLLQYIDWALDQGALSLAVQIGKSFSDDTQIDSEILFQTEQLFHTVLKKNSISYKIYWTVKENSLVVKSTSLLNFDMEVIGSEGKSLGVKGLKSRGVVVYVLGEKEEKVRLIIKGTKIQEELIVNKLETIQLTNELLENKITKKHSSPITQLTNLTLVAIVTSLTLLISATAYCLSKHRLPSPPTPNLKQQQSQLQIEESSNFIQEDGDNEKHLQKEMQSVETDQGGSPIATTERIFLE